MFPFYATRDISGRLRAAWVGGIVGVVCVLGVGLRAGDDQGTDFFERRIRPVLVHHCYECHSESATEVEGDLLVDSRAAIRKGGESGAAVVPGKPDESLLIEAIHYRSLEMPPNGKLPEEIVADLEKWVAMGAPDPRDHPDDGKQITELAWQKTLKERSSWWSLQPPAQANPPELVVSKWSTQPVDRFILAGLRARQLQPASDAGGLTLLRRLAFVLTGLPPATESIASFTEQHASDPDGAFAAAVDEFLKSPRFGERFARHWMDVVRYTDTYGYEWDILAKGSWEYRDYLIRAFNQDIGFDQLIREQIAGDLLPQPRFDAVSGLNESLIGPMFYHMGEHRHGDNLIINGVREETIDNKIDAFSKTFLAMTVACARCHDHKRDAISQRDYYALASVMMTPRWTSRSIEAPGTNAAAISELIRLRDEIQSRLADAWTTQEGPLASGATLHTWAARNRSSLIQARLGDTAWPLKQLLSKPVWLDAKNIAAQAAAKSTALVLAEDGSILARGEAAESDTYTVTFTTDPGSVSQIRIEALTHESLGSKGPGRTPHGNFVLSQIRVDVKPYAEGGTAPGDSFAVTLVDAEADYSQPDYPVTDALKPEARKGWAVGLGGNVDRTAWFTFAEPVDLPHGGEWTVALDHRYGTHHVLGRFRVTPGINHALSADQTGQNDKVAAETWQQITAEWIGIRDARRKSNTSRFKLLSDFSQPAVPDGWVIDGDGMHYGYVTGGQPLISLEGDMVVKTLLRRGYHTHALSSKLPGALRLPSQEDMPGKYVSVKIAGGEWSGYFRLSDNAFLTEEIKFFNHNEPSWFALDDVAANNGIQRVAFEIATSDLFPNFPPRTGLAVAGSLQLPNEDEGFDKRSWYSVTRILTHDQPGQPEDELNRYVSLFSGPAVASSADAWQRLRDWLVESITNWKRDTADDDDVAVLNGMIGQKLLTNTAAPGSKLAQLVDSYREVERLLPFPRTVNSMDERGVEAVTYALNMRGDINHRGDPLSQNFLEVFEGHHRVGTTDSSGRLELAEFLTDSQNGLAPRVYVNRVWQWVFGTGLVSTTSDFGRLGDQPSHPELLDYLTREFIADGWSTKRLVRRLVLSRTFRQSGTVSETATTVDPGNRLFHHYPTRRLEAEAIRDALLSVSGRLDDTLYGRPINPRRHVEDSAKRLFTGPLDGHGRRSIYLEVSIMDRSRFLKCFNSPDPKLPTGRRDQTNVPAQALALLNDPFVLAMADEWADQLVQNEDQTREKRIREMFLRAFGRPAQLDEAERWIALADAFSANDGKSSDSGERDTWKHVAHVMFNAKEFIYYR